MEKLYKKIIIAIICCIIFTLGVFNKSTFAENETTNTSDNTNDNTTVNAETNTAGGTSTNTDNTNNENIRNNTTNTAPKNTQTTTSTAKKSNNANLSNLGIKPCDFSGFKPGNTSYSVTVPNNTASVEVYANAQSSSAKVSGTGTKSLETGKNKIDVVVTAEDGTKKTYTINITRKEESESNTEMVQERYSGDGLAALKIGDLTLSPSFDTTIYEYSVKYIGDDTKLDITATATDPYYTVAIVGNEDLKEGENIINILVSDPDDENVAIYQVTVDKSLVDEEAVARQKEEQRRKLIIVGVIVLLVFFIILTICFIRYKRKKDDYEYYDDDKHENEDKENKNQLEDYDNDMKFIGNNGEMELTKEQAREKFLNNYNNEELADETKKKRKSKGKRFK